MPEGMSPDEATAGAFVTFAGAGFGTVQIERAAGSDPVPDSVSGPGHLRENLPGIYADGDLGMRFVGALEEVLDPLMATLDNLAEHFRTEYAPRDVLDLLTRWLGLEHDESRTGEDRRQIVRHAPELMRLRGTKAGLELALKLAFPGIPFRVEDAGGVTWSLDPADAGEPVAPSFVVYCDMPLEEKRLAAVARLIESAKPAQATHRLRVRAAKKSSS